MGETRLIHGVVSPGNEVINSHKKAIEAAASSLAYVLTDASEDHYAFEVDRAIIGDELLITVLTAETTIRELY